MTLPEDQLPEDQLPEDQLPEDQLPEDERAATLLIFEAAHPRRRSSSGSLGRCCLGDTLAIGLGSDLIGFGCST